MKTYVRYRLTGAAVHRSSGQPAFVGCICWLGGAAPGSLGRYPFSAGGRRRTSRLDRPTQGSSCDPVTSPSAPTRIHPFVGRPVRSNIGSFLLVDTGHCDILRHSVAGDVEQFRPGTPAKDQAPRGHLRQVGLWRPIVLVQPKGVARDRIGGVLGNNSALGPPGTATKIVDVARCSELVYLAVLGDGGGSHVAAPTSNEGHALISGPRP